LKILESAKLLKQRVIRVGIERGHNISSPFRLSGPVRIWVAVFFHSLPIYAFSNRIFIQKLLLCQLIIVCLYFSCDVRVSRHVSIHLAIVTK
jgi:hypothetical protein